MNKQGEARLLITNGFRRRGSGASLVATAGALLFLILTGLMIWRMPFSVTSQMAVLFHTAAGLLVAVPFAFWQLRHWRATRKAPRTASKVSAYVAFWLLAANFVSGFIITYQAAFGVLSSHGWAGVHRWTGILVVPLIAYHVFPRQAPAGATALEPVAGIPAHPWLTRRWLWMGCLGTAALLLAVLVGASASYHSVDLGAYTPPASFRAAPGPNPFAPSNARTETGAPVRPEAIGNSRACGAPACHATIYEEWRSSAHRWSEEDQFFQAVRTATTEVQGIKATEKCGGCHAPVSMLSGYKDPTLGHATSGYTEGESCIVCHAVRQVDERGIGSYLLGIPQAYLGEYSKAPSGGFVNHFLIRVYPEQHDRDYNLKIAREAESCAPCHKEYDRVGTPPRLLEVETQYDDWKQHKWNTDRDTARRLRCEHCHMYLESAPSRSLADPYDLAVGLGREYHNHRFAAANQYMPLALGVAGAEAQTHDVNEWLTGKQNVPEIQKVWPRGPVVTMTIAAPPSVRAGADLAVRVNLNNSKAGHSFPTGPLNVVRVWIDLEVYDQAGKKVYHSGELDRDNHVEAGSFILRPIAITPDGHSILTPDIWHPHGPLFRPAINPGESESLDYRFPVPRAVRGPLLLRARLRYRKANQFFLNAIYAPEHREAPITDVSSASAETAVLP